MALQSDDDRVGSSDAGLQVYHRWGLNGFLWSTTDYGTNGFRPYYEKRKGFERAIAAFELGSVLLHSGWFDLPNQPFPGTVRMNVFDISGGSGCSSDGLAAACAAFLSPS